ncbi:hypothetical protein [Streptomyces sp. NPDC001594]
MITQRVSKPSRFGTSPIVQSAVSGSSKRPKASVRES